MNLSHKTISISDLPEEFRFYQGESVRPPSITKEKLLELSDEQLKEFDQKIQEYNDKRQEVNTKNSNAYKYWFNLVFKGSKPTKTELKSFIFVIEKLGWKEHLYEKSWKDYIHFMSASSNLYNSSKSIYDYITKYKQQIKQEEDKKMRKEKYQLYLISKGKELDLDINEYEDIKDYTSHVEEILQDKWREEHWPDGTEMHIKCCDRCSTWTVGDHRCSCGNRRISLIIEGNNIDGYFAYAEAY